MATHETAHAALSGVTGGSRARPEEEPAGASRIRWWLIALFVGAFTVSCTEFVPVGLLPQIAADLSVSASAAGQLVTANALAFAVGAPVLAAAFARVDRRRLLLGTLAVYAAGHVLAATAPNYPVLLASRIVSGATMGLYLATAIAVAARLAAPSHRARSMATIVAGVSTATALGVPVSTLLGQGTGWRVPMLGISALAVLALGFVAVTVARSGTDDGPPLKVRLAALRNRLVLTGLAAITVFWAASFAVYTYVVPLLESRAGIQGAPVTAVLFLAGLGAVGGNFLGGRGADARPRTTLLLTVGVTAAALLVALPATTTPLGAVLLIAVWQLAAWSFVPAVQATLYQAAGPGGDLAVSFAVSGFNVGIVAGAGLGGVALDAGGLNAVVLFGAGLAVLALVFVILLVNNHRRRNAGDGPHGDGPHEDGGQDTHETAGPERHFDAVLFDMDGTLLDSGDAVVRAWRRWAQEEGVPPELVSSSTGRPAREVIAGLVPPGRVAESLALHLRIATEEVRGVVVLPGAPEALSGSRSRTAIVTSSTRPVAAARLNAAGLDEPRLMVTAEDIVHGKPAPEPYLLAAERLGLEPGRCLAVEDSATGIAAARAAGCTTLSVAPAEADADALGADMHATELAQLDFRAQADGVVVSRSAQAAADAPRT